MLSHKLRRYKAPAVSNTDASFKQVSLLLHGDGTNGAQNNTFLDSSTNNFTVTRNGNTTQGTNTPFSQADGYWSNYNPTASSLTVATNAAFTYGVSDFTMECWVYLTTTGAIQYIIDQRNSGTANAVIPAIYVSASNVLTYFVSNAAQITGTTALTTGAWYHVAVSRSTLSTKMFLNGVQEGSTYTDANSYAASRVVIGSNAATAGNYLVGYVSNVRLVNGTGVYTTTFTPSTTPLTAITNTKLLTCQSNYFKDNSSNNFTVTATGTPSVQPFSPFAPTAAYSTSVNGGSLYFDGTADYLTFNASSAEAFATGNYTVEGWFYQTVNSGSRIVLDCRPSVAAVPFTVSFESGAPSWYNGASNTSSTAIALNAWNHVAWVREGTGTNQAKIYINGVVAHTFTDTTNYGTMNTAARIGYNLSNSAAFAGYMSNLRTVKGTAVYTTTFTPPTAPLTAITNTSLLLNGTNAGIFDNAIKNDLETVGNAQVSTSVVKYGTGSMKFDGTGDYLYIPFTPQYIFGAGKWTVEFWVNPTVMIGNFLELNSENSGGFASIRIAPTTGGAMYLLCSTGSTWISTSTTASGLITTGTWYHIAAVRNGSTFTLYINGTSRLTYSSASALSNAGLYSFIGCDYSSNTAAGFMNGYIDDLRVTKGVARYTANFTPPTAAFPNS